MNTKEKDDLFLKCDKALKEAAEKLSCGGKFYPMDLYLNAIINRAMAINEAYFRVAKLNNYIAAAPYIRMQMDNCISAYAPLLIDEKDVLKFINHFIAGKDLYKFKAANKNPLYEKYVVQELNKKYPMFKKGYEQGSFYSDDETSCHDNNMCFATRRLIDLILNKWLPYKEYMLEQLEKKQQEENIPMNQIIRELIKDYPEILKLLTKEGTA